MADCIQLQLMLGGTRPRPAPRAVIDAFAGLQVTSSVDGASGFQLTLDLGRVSPLFPLLSDGTFDPPARFVAAVIWNSVTTVLIDGEVMRHDLDSSQGSTSGHLTLTGEDLTGVMNRESRVHLFDGEGLDAQVRRICATYGQYGIAVHAVAPPQPDTLSSRERSDTQRETDLSYLSRIAESVGYVFYLQPGPDVGSSTAYWGPERRTGQPQPALTANADSNSTVETLSFAFDGGLRIQYLRSDGQPVSTAATRPPLAARVPTPLVTRQLPPVARYNNTEVTMRGGALSADADMLTGSGRLDVRRYGQVLRSRELVGVRGAGEFADGLHFVTSVTHELAIGSYHQSFRLARDGVGPLARTVRTS